MSLLRFKVSEQV